MSTQFAYGNYQDKKLIIGTYDEKGELALLSSTHADSLKEIGLEVATQFRPTKTEYVVYSKENRIAKLTPIPERNSSSSQEFNLPNPSRFYDQNGIVVKLIGTGTGTGTGTEVRVGGSGQSYMDIGVIQIHQRCPYLCDNPEFSQFQCDRTD